MAASQSNLGQSDKDMQRYYGMHMKTHFQRTLNDHQSYKTSSNQDTKQILKYLNELKATGIDRLRLKG